MGNWAVREKRDAERRDEIATRARGTRLADRAIDICRRPVLPETVLESYKTPRAGAGAY